jgi:hypothetical protein
MGMSDADVRLIIARSKGKLLAARLPRPTPFVDTTLYVSWNAMFVSAYLDAARTFGGKLGEECRAFALKTLDRIIAEAWDDARGFAHRFGSFSENAGRLEGGLDDQVVAGLALLDAYEATLDKKYFTLAERAVELLLSRFFDPQDGGFFDRARDAAPLGGLDAPRKPFQDSPTPSGNSSAIALLDRLYGFTGNTLYRERAEKTLEAFAGIAPQYGLFAASYGPAAVLHARHPVQVVITGAAGDAQAARLAQTAGETFRFGKALLRVTPELIARDGLAPALQQTLPHLDAKIPQALVCVETTCHPPVNEPEKLTALLTNLAANAAS